MNDCICKCNCFVTKIFQHKIHSVHFFQVDQEVVVEVEQQRKEEPVGDGVVQGQRKWYLNSALLTAYILLIFGIP